MKNHSINVDNEIKNYALRADGIDAGDAMDVLIRMYLDNCGISLTDRTLAENAIHFWIARWRESHPELSKNTGLYDMMDLRSEKYRNNKDFYDRYDVTCIDAEDSLRYCQDMLRDYTDDITRIALCAGILYWQEIDF